MSKTIKSFNLTDEQIEKINELSVKANRSASAIVGMAIDVYYECITEIDECSEMNVHVPFKKVQL